MSLSSVCEICGKELSFWDKFLRFDKKLCPECRARKEEKLNIYIKKIYEFGEDMYLTKEEEKALLELKASLGLSDEDMKKAEKVLNELRKFTKEANILYYKNKLLEFSKDEELTKCEELKLKEIAKELNLTEMDISFTMPYYYHIKFITEIRKGILPQLTTDIILKRGEVCHYEVICGLIEERTKTRYEGKSNGISIRLTKGVYYRIGKNKGEKIIDTYSTVTDKGYLYITNKRVIFVGGKKNVTYPINKIVNFTCYKNGIQFQKENESRYKFFRFNNEYAVDEIGTLLSMLTEAEE